MKLIPYLYFNGTAEAAMNFYKEVLGAEIGHINRFSEGPMPLAEEDKNKVMHSNFQFDGNTVMVSDTPKGKQLNENGNIQLSVDADSVEKINELFPKMAEGGTITMELQDTFWGARFGMLKDKFGISWMFNVDKK
ncbi:MAG: VOC family protein [Ferruginibacter sp.]